ncbi:MAG TPA: glycosyl hydrolase family 65 protein [Gaiellaceae bacterium]|nr:glycosyl hydrolase family 65 protein [Gaiellaceae bacterium]
MIDDPDFPVEPWSLRETGLHVDLLGPSESIFALANGHIGLRGNLDEGEPSHIPGSYLSGFYEEQSLPYAEGGFGYPEAREVAVNVTNGKILRLLVNDEPFDIRLGDLLGHERVLDFREGVLRRRVDWRSPAGQRALIRSTRLVSFAQRAVAAICYEVEPLEDQARVVVQSELVANEATPPQSDDPRAAAALAAPLESDLFGEIGSKVAFVHTTKRSRLRLAAAMDHLVEGPESTEVGAAEMIADLGRVTIRADLEPGQRLRVVKFLAYGWSSRRSAAALRDQVAAALAEARHSGWEGLLAAQRAYLDDFWQRADVELEGDAELQQALRFALFHVLQAGARAERRAIAAKGLTGPGYNGHTFWDSETFVLPVLTYTAAEAARDVLRWRHSTLPLACERAQLLGFEGAAFPWRTIGGEECSSYWPAGTAAFHVSADIADATARYIAATGDEEFERTTGLELLAETARLWRSLGHYDSEGRFRIDGVTGPDEYGAIADNNVYTNLMAQRNLRLAADAVERHDDRSREIGIDREEAAAWREAARAMFVPYDARLGVHPQAESFTEYRRWDFENTKPDQYPLFLHFHYFDLYRKQVVKQADLVLALHLRGDAFTDEEKARNFAYYEQLTVRDSSLSACTQAVIAAEVGHLELAYDYFAEAALIDLDNLAHNTADGVHIGSLAGAWIAAVCGFGGLRDHDGKLTFAPRLPRRLSRLAFGICFRGQRLQVEVEPTTARYTLTGGAPLQFSHHGETLTVTVDDPVVREIPVLPVREPPSQPQGRAPARRQPGSA